MARVPIHPDAQAEYESAVRRYGRDDPARARQFSAAAERVFADIARQPSRYGWHDDEYREAPVGKFPYVVIYRDHDPFVVAVSHTSREPDYWRDRV